MEKYKIALCGTYFMESVGDSLLFECVKYLYQYASEKKKLDVEFTLVDLNGIKSFDELKRYTLKWFAKKIPQKLYKIFTGEKNYNISEDPKYYLEAFSTCDLVVVLGGGLFKYGVNRDYTKVFECINNAANDIGIPVVYNAVGVEGPHCKGTPEFEAMKKAFKNGVRIFSVRDRYDVAQAYFDDTNIDYRLVGDTGVFVDEAFKAKGKNEGLIGVNPVAYKHFKPYFPNVDKDTIFDIWMGILEELLSSGYKILLFTNGDLNDAEFANELYQSLKKRGFSLQIAKAKNANEMVENISRCKIVIASRLHTCISAYSLDIPAVGLAWNNKLLYWSENIGAESMFFDYDHFNKVEILGAFKKIDDGFNYDEVKRKWLENSLIKLADDAVEMMIENSKHSQVDL